MLMMMVMMMMMMMMMMMIISNTFLLKFCVVSISNEMVGGGGLDVVLRQRVTGAGKKLL